MKQLTTIQFVIIRDYLYDCLEKIEFGRNIFESDITNEFRCKFRFYWQSDYFESLHVEVWDLDGNDVEVNYDQEMELEKVLYLKWDKLFN
jgi:hypothetical protein